MAEYQWVDSCVNDSIPSTAFEAGVDINGEKIYVGKAFYKGDWLPAKVIPLKKLTFISWCGSEISVDHYQVLCGKNFVWVPDSNGSVPEGAVAGGKTARGETLYIGRVDHCGSKTIGKIHPSHQMCYIPFGRREISYKDYEVLVLQREDAPIYPRRLVLNKCETVAIYPSY